MKAQQGIRGVGLFLLVAAFAGCSSLLPPPMLTGSLEQMGSLEEKAQAGDASAQYQVGLCYGKGVFVGRNPVAAVKWFQKAANQGHAHAQYDLGVHYDEGDGVAPNAIQAARWWRQAAEQGLPWAQNDLGLCYARGHGVDKDAGQAARWFRLAAQQGLASAQNNFGLCCVTGQGVDKDAVEAVKWFRRASRKGDAGAQRNLGVCYQKGDGVIKDAAEAARWYRRAADKGLPDAQNLLGLCYLKGDGVSRDASQALDWFFKAAGQGFAPAQVNLGVCYCRGEGVARDAAKAVTWFRGAAVQGHAPGQVCLGDAYRLGDGVARDEAEALEWYRRAADQGCAEALVRLGGLYLAHGMATEASSALATAQAQVAVAIADGAASAESLDDLAWCFVENKIRPAEALEYTRRALSMEPQNPAFLATHGWALLRNGRYAESLSVFCQVITNRSTAGGTSMNSAWAGVSEVGRSDVTREVFREFADSMGKNLEGDTVGMTRLNQALSPFYRKHGDLARACGIPSRDPATKASLIDLSRFYNGGLKWNWHGDTAENNLTALPTGIQTMAGAQFDIRGLVQVSWELPEHPVQVTNIPVERACQRLHFLHAAIKAGQAEDGAQIGRYVIHYEGGERREIPLVVGKDLADWFEQPNDGGRTCVVAWTGANAESQRKNTRIRLFKTTWPNPLPDTAIRSIDFEALDRPASPFLVALTVE